MNRQINTINDIVEVLRENPDALTELRSVMFPGDAGVPEEKLDELLQLVRRQEVAGARRDEAERGVKRLKHDVRRRKSGGMQRSPEWGMPSLLSQTPPRAFVVTS